MEVKSKGRRDKRTWLVVELSEEEKLISNVIQARIDDGLSDQEECRRWAKHFFDLWVRKGTMKVDQWGDWQQVCGLDT